MRVTINTDASFHPELKFGAYAFWAISDKFKITKSGVFKAKCKNPHDAEIKCIINALKVVLHGHEGITKVIINTDSLNAISVLENHKENIKKYRLGWAKLHRVLYHNIVTKSLNKCSIEFRHVKAHSGISDKRSYVNEWCDSWAKTHLRQKVRESKNEIKNS